SFCPLYPSNLYYDWLWLGNRIVKTLFLLFLPVPSTYFDREQSFYTRINKDPYKNTPTTPNLANFLLNICSKAYTPMERTINAGDVSISARISAALPAAFSPIQLKPLMT